MAEEKRWYLICYDVRAPERLRKTYRLLKGYGVTLQYSMFRCRMNNRQLERLRWELERVLTDEDSLMITSLCGQCVGRVILRNPRTAWDVDEIPLFRIL